jgi:potassium-transporting ATPase KdpC subunit
MKQLKTACIVLGVFSLLLGIVYPLVITGIAQVLFPHRANGSLITFKSRVVGSELIGQSFSSPGYFHGRPSDCSYDAAHSSSSNLGPSNPELFKQVQERINQVRSENGLTDTTSVPADLVLASGSGLDPDISPQSARLQVTRIAKFRNLPEAVLQKLVEGKTQKPIVSLFGPPRVNVLTLNLALDSISSQIWHNDSIRGAQ